MRNLLALLLLLALLTAPFFSFSQIPGYLPENGLAAFYPLDSNWQDLSIHGNHAINYGATAGLDRNGDEFGSMHFDGQSWLEIPHSESVGMDHGDSLTWSVWIRFDNIDDPQNIFEKWNDASSTPYSQLMLRANGSYSGQYLHTMAYCGVGFENEGRCNATNQEDFQAGWFHALMRTNGQSSEFFINGYLMDSRFHCSEGCGNTSPLYLGARNATNPQKFFGQLDEFAVWSRYLTDEEIANLAFSGEPVIGCTDPVACNYMEQANFDDGSCYSCSIPSGHCGTGTFWDAESQLCVVANPTDADLDGCTGVGDILEVLSTFGQCYTAVDTNWICGDPLTYWDYDYSTVLIGDQCWFAENLRNERFNNGDSIPYIIENDDWAALTTPGMCWYQHNPAGQAQLTGGLYNWYSVNDIRQLCPSGWHVSTDEDWMALEFSSGMDSSEIATIGFRGIASQSGVVLKASLNWCCNSNGTDSLGFNGQAGGWRNGPGGFGAATSNGIWWTSNDLGWWPMRRDLLASNDGVQRCQCSGSNDGFSVRCIKD